MEQQAGAGGRPVAMQKPQIDNVTLEEWLVPSFIDEDPIGVLVLHEQDDTKWPWEYYPEAIMLHSSQLKYVILQRICREFFSLAKWMKRWDEMVAAQEWARLRESRTRRTMSRIKQS